MSLIEKVKVREWKIFKPDEDTVLGIAVLASQLPIGETVLVDRRSFDKLARMLELCIKQRDSPMLRTFDEMNAELAAIAGDE